MSQPLNLTPEEVNELFPIVGMRVSRGGLVLVRYSNLSTSQIKRQRLRGLIKKLSRRSLSKLAFTVVGSRVRFQSLLTVTYGQNYPIDGKRVKADLKAFLMAMRRHYGEFEYCWVIEFQARGAPHFHILLTLENPSQSDRTIVASLWSRIAEKENFAYSMVRLLDGKLKRWGETYTRDAVRKKHNEQKTWENFRNIDGASRYIISYSCKLYQKRVPDEYVNVGRFWGTSRGVPNTDDIYFSATEREVRELASLLGRNLDQFAVLPKIVLINGQQFDEFTNKVYNDIK